MRPPKICARRNGLPYGTFSRTLCRMKTTIDVDEKKLAGVMRLTGVHSRKAAVDYALACTERIETLRKLFEKALPDEEYKGALDPAYDLMAVRKKDRPTSHVAR
jgi:Arc/MetJ family transcription regulator